eukprot:COSAG01_NODE_1362_length_10565_cov_111.342156_5_plen_157_part_00
MLMLMTSLAMASVCVSEAAVEASAASAVSSGEAANRLEPSGVPRTSSVMVMAVHAAVAASAGHAAPLRPRCCPTLRQNSMATDWIQPSAVQPVQLSALPFHWSRPNVSGPGSSLPPPSVPPPATAAAPHATSLPCVATGHSREEIRPGMGMPVKVH